MTPGRKDVSLMLDSGAFSAWTKKESIDVEDYGKFLQKHGNDFDLIVNLDVIPGEFGQKAVPYDEMIQSIEQGWYNYHRLVEMGIPKKKLIHVFHQGEPFSYLEKMVNEMEYIGISPANDRTTSEKKVWLDECMRYVLNGNGKPLVKFHGFGMTSLHLIWRYPWFSIDSTTWVLVGAMGGLLIPKTKFGRFTYRESPIILPVTMKNQPKEKKHYFNLSEIEQSKVHRYLKDRGFDIKKVQDDGMERDRANMQFFLDLEQTLENTKVYFAGNFPMLHKIEREFKTMDLALKTTDKWRRLGSYYHQSYLLKLLDLKRRKDAGTREKRKVRKIRVSKVRRRTTVSG